MQAGHPRTDRRGLRLCLHPGRAQRADVADQIERDPLDPLCDPVTIQRLYEISVEVLGDIAREKDEHSLANQLSGDIAKFLTIEFQLYCDSIEIMSDTDAHDLSTFYGLNEEAA